MIFKAITLQFENASQQQQDIVMAWLATLPVEGIEACNDFSEDLNYFYFRIDQVKYSHYGISYQLPVLLFFCRYSGYGGRNPRNLRSSLEKTEKFISLDLLYMQPNLSTDTM